MITADCDRTSTTPRRLENKEVGSPDPSTSAATEDATEDIIDCCKIIIDKSLVLDDDVSETAYEKYHNENQHTQAFQASSPSSSSKGVPDRKARQIIDRNNINYSSKSSREGNNYNLSSGSSKKKEITYYRKNIDASPTNSPRRSSPRSSTKSNSKMTLNSNSVSIISITPRTSRSRLLLSPQASSNRSRTNSDEMLRQLSSSKISKEERQHMENLAREHGMLVETPRSSVSWFVGNRYYSPVRGEEEVRKEQQKNINCLEFSV